MAEVCDEWASRKRPNLWNAIPEMAEMQSEAGAAGAVILSSCADWDGDASWLGLPIRDSFGIRCVSD